MKREKIKLSGTGRRRVRDGERIAQNIRYWQSEIRDNSK